MASKDDYVREVALEVLSRLVTQFPFVYNELIDNLVATWSRQQRGDEYSGCSETHSSGEEVTDSCRRQKRDQNGVGRVSNAA